MTQLREYYDALHALKEQEQTALAEAHAKDPRLLLHRFRHSLKALDGLAIDEPFYPPQRKDPRTERTPVDGIKKTIHFAAQVCDRRPRAVKGASSLAFRYVDRELFPLRTTALGRVPRRSLDLLLANRDDRTPIFAELKIRGDRLAYFAFVQALMHAAELLLPTQRQRLSAHTHATHLEWSQQGPFADIYIIAFEPPTRGTYRERSLVATEQIAKRILEYEEFSRYIRRIACVDAFVMDARLVFEKRFAFGDGV